MLINSKHTIDFIDLTNTIKNNIPIKDGICLVSSLHTTLAIKIMEDESLSKQDLKILLDKIAPSVDNYYHDIIGLRDVPPDERINGHSHCKMLFLNTSETIPVKDNSLLLGKWQSIMAIETDGAREREILITYIGE